ncbi:MULTISPECIES: M48 family metalloprotease [unclassified Beijerinckia]|uniref:M48 family metalloprotease n=1 Tax=unclassified Beijerinckia TaxID=2638183 RepID=UPI000899D222|nr:MULTISPECIES: M48 family metalloprotease [unclassified Beijerinckia]MDH7794857.1 putative Zn-dependent protease [Beijerinckia sp. GAS462]SEB78051.1 Putative Zn-dependent protease, contains TPR repeats [Beijerinckia sp. 28-YEA-48]
MSRPLDFPPTISRRSPNAYSPMRLAAITLAYGLAISGIVTGTGIATGLPARAQEASQIIVRDAETEQLMRDYATPIFRAAGVNAGATRIILVQDRAFNAFVANGRKIFLNLGTIMEAKTPGEMIGVIAHETGHIAGGHLVRQRLELANAQIYSVAGLLLGAGAVVGASRSRQVGTDSGGAMGAILGPQEMVRRALLSYQRSEEQAADIAAVKYLNASGQSPKGLLTTLERFQNEMLFKSQALDPYLLSHPLPAERVSNLQQQARRSPNFDKPDNPALQARHDLVRAKVIAFVGNTSETGRRYPLSDTSLAARYARAVAAYRNGRLPDALGQIDALIATQPNNAYFHELKGQALLEAGRAGQAIEPLRRAAALAPRGVPIRVMLGHAYVATNNPTYANDAIRVLTRTTQEEDDNAEAFQFLAMAYERKGDQANAMLSAAQGLFLVGKFVEARTQADRAKRLFKDNSPGWLKADDILEYRPPKD